MIWVRSVLFNIVFYSGVLVILIMGSPALFFGQKASRWIFKLIGEMTMFLCRVLLNITYEVRGQDKLPKEQALYACKHQSVWEAGALLRCLPRHSSILKKELMYIPLYGQYLRCSGMIGVDRRQGSKALPMMVGAVQAIYKHGGEIFMFPEGTRTAPGERGDYKRGIAMLYEKLKVPVVPMALNSGLFWPRRKFVKCPGKIILEFLEPIPPGLPRGEFMQRLEDAIETASSALYREGLQGSRNV